MKLIFVGSLEKKTTDYTTIRQQFSKLINHLVEHGCDFVIRGSSGENEEFISIDLVVLEDLIEIQKSKSTPIRLITFDQVGKPSTPIPAGLIASNHSDSSETRAEMYAEINSLVDIIVGVGGRHGLMRHSIACEYTNKPFFPLPGTGGVCEELWADFIRKGKVILNCSESDRRLIKNSPLATQNSPEYGRTVLNAMEAVIANTIRIANEEIARKEKIKETIDLDLKKMTIPDIIKGVKRLSLGSIFTLITATFAIYIAGVSTATNFQHLKQAITAINNQQWPTSSKPNP